MQPVSDFKNLPPDFWALVKLCSIEIGYSKRGKILTYTPDDIRTALEKRDLNPKGIDDKIEIAAMYSVARSDLLHDKAESNLMNRTQAEQVFHEIRERVQPDEKLTPMNKQRGEKRHRAFLTGIVNMLTYESLLASTGDGTFESDPRGPLTFARDGIPLRTLLRRMDGAFPDLNAPRAAWEIKEYYGTTSFGSRVADGIYESALDGYELNELREEGVDVKHFLFVDDHYTWWECGKSYLCRIVDMIHIGLLDAAYFGREVVVAWPDEIAAIAVSDN